MLEINITSEEAYMKFPFLKKLNSDEARELLAAILLLMILLPKSNDTLVNAIQAVLKN